MISPHELPLDEKFSFLKEWPLSQIQSELNRLLNLMNSNQSNETDDFVDEKYVDALIQAQQMNHEYKLFMENEYNQWRESIKDFIDGCLERCRSFIPVDIFSLKQDDLVTQYDLSPELAKRVQSKQCLWLCRMSSEEICRLHFYDLTSRFTISQQQLDIIEVAGIYASLPLSFPNDSSGKKLEWRQNIENTLKQMLMEYDDEILPPSKIRNDAYKGLQFGPILDTTSVRPYEITTSSLSNHSDFREVCMARFGSNVKSNFELIDGLTEQESLEYYEKLKNYEKNLEIERKKQEKIFSHDPSYYNDAEEEEDEELIAAREEEEIENERNKFNDLGNYYNDEGEEEDNDDDQFDISIFNRSNDNYYKVEEEEVVEEEDEPDTYPTEENEELNTSTSEDISSTFLANDLSDYYCREE